MWQSAILLFLLFIPSCGILFFVKVIFPTLAQIKCNMECGGKFIFKFNPEIITFSDHVFAESTGKGSYKAVPHSHLPAVKENPLLAK